MHLHLFIGNKAYSSWSLRPWILMTHFDIPFEETVIPLNQPTSHVEFLRYGPTGKVPVLHADDIVVWESLAILEFLADLYPQKPIWPAGQAARAMARAMSSEMHAGFAKLRSTCPTNFRRAPKPTALSDEVRAEIDRIEAAWAAARHEHGAGGPFLFGQFTAADAMYAPVVNRLHAYAVEVRPETRAYMEATMALPAWRKWIEGAQAEPWTMDHYDRL